MSAIIGFFAKMMGYVMRFIYNVVDNYALSIVIITVLVRLIILPLYAKQQKEMAKMNELQVKVQEIQERYARDRQTMNQKINELYADAGVSTYSGCLPLLIQFPFMLGLYDLLRQPLNYMMQYPYMIAAVHEKFLWVADLSQPDSWILPILAGLTTYLTTVASMAGQSDASAGAMKGMKYFMPLMIFLLGRSLPAGLSLYWIVGNIFMVIQTLISNKKRAKEKAQKEIEAEVLKRKKAEK